MFQVQIEAVEALQLEAGSEFVSMATSPGHVYTVYVNLGDTPAVQGTIWSSV